MTIYELCENCGEYVDETDYFAGEGLVCKKCSKKLRENASSEKSEVKKSE